LVREVNLFFLDKRTQITLDLVAQIQEDSPESRLIVVDLSSFHYPLQPPWRVRGHLCSRSTKVLEMFNKLGVDYVNGASRLPNRREFSSSESVKIGIAIRSTIMSWHSRGTKKNSRRGLIEILISRRLSSQALRVFSLTKDLLSEFSPTSVFVENGRFALPHATYLAAQSSQVKVLFYEASQSDRSVYMHYFRVHDRIEMQKNALESTSSLPNSLVNVIASDFMQKQAKNNSFKSLWSASEDAWKGPRESLALFATSSSDENYSMDLDWNEASWESQYEAFQAIWNQLKPLNLTPVLRIHPNMLNKRPSAARTEIREIKRFQSRNPEFQLVWPQSPVSTDSLISFANVVVVSNSTVGLEASLKGVPVICADSCAYDLIADVVRVLGPKDLIKVAALSKAPDPLGAQRYVAFQQIKLMHVPENKFGVVLSNLSKSRLFIASIVDGSIVSIVFELRWKIYRWILLNTSLRAKN